LVANNNGNGSRGNAQQGGNRGNTSGRSASPKKDIRMGEFTVIAKGTLKNINDNFKVTYGQSTNGVSYLNGCKLEINKPVNDRTVTLNMNIVAFGDAADDLQDVCEGCWLEVVGYIGKKQGKDGGWFDQLVITEVENIEFE
jgi:primosomal replication protein N